MPSYDYRCKKCGHRFEAFQKITDEPLMKCPQCSGQVERLISGGNGLIFKGSGFYITDYKSGNEKKETKAESHTASSKEGHNTGKKAVA
jgi:putative FmdB family regulatory protein